MKANRMLSIFIPLLLGATLATADPWKGESGHGHGGPKGKGPDVEHRQGPPERDTYFHEHGYTRLDIPPGHYPPPGQCRVWFPDRPPGHQPPPVRCRGARVPPGAWLMRHPADRPDHVHVTVYDPYDPGRVQVVGEFEIGSGVFIRVVLD